MAGLIEGRIAVVTGAGSGVGRAAVKLFVEHGAKVLAADVNLAAAEESVRLAGGEARAFACDVADEAQVTAMVQAAVDAWGRLDILYNNAGFTLSNSGGVMKTLTTTSADEIERMFGVNTTGVLFGCQAAIRQYDAQGSGGVIVNTASVAGLTGFGGVVYGATKGAVVSMTRTLALEVASKGIRVNSVCPSGMYTQFAGLDPDSPNAEKIRAGMDAMAPLGRALEPIDCANAALFLASDLARCITGINMPVDSGLTAGIPLRR